MTAPAPWARMCIRSIEVSPSPPASLPSAYEAVARMDLPAPVSLLDRDESAVMLHDASTGRLRRHVWPDHLLTGGEALWQRRPATTIGICRCDDCRPGDNPAGWRHRWMIRLADGAFLHVEADELQPV